MFIRVKREERGVDVMIEYRRMCWEIGKSMKRLEERQRGWVGERWGGCGEEKERERELEGERRKRGKE